MDRRRFVPSAEGLEVRSLLSTAPAVLSPLGGASSTLPETLQAKTIRIERLPILLRSVQLSRTRFLPADTIAHIEADLTGIKGKLHTLNNPTVRTNFELELRRTLRHPSLAPRQAIAL